MLVDWHGTWRILASRLGWQAAGAAPGSGSARRVAPAAAWTGAALLLVIFACGALRIHSWPFSMYPRLDRVRTEPHQSMLEARVERADGSVERIRPPMRVNSLVSLLQVEDPDARARRLAAFAEPIRTDGVGLGPGDRLRLYEVTRSILPDDDRRERGRVQLFELEEPLPLGGP